MPTANWRLPSILYLNTRSIVNKLDEMARVIDTQSSDVARVTAAWLSDRIPTVVTTIDGFACERRDRDGARGWGSDVHQRLCPLSQTG